MKPAGRAHAPWDEFLLLCFFLSQFIFFLYNIIAEIKTGCRRIIHFIVCNDFWLPCWFLCTDSRMCTRAALTALCACFPDEETPGLYGFLHVIVHSAKGFEQSASKSARNSFFFFFLFPLTALVRTLRLSICLHIAAAHILVCQQNTWPSQSSQPAHAVSIITWPRCKGRKNQEREGENEVVSEEALKPKWDSCGCFR